LERWNGAWPPTSDLEPTKLGTGERHKALALGPTEDEYSESVLRVGEGER